MNRKPSAAALDDAKLAGAGGSPAALTPAQPSAPQQTPAAQGSAAVAAPARFDNLKSEISASGEMNLDVILDVQVQLSLEVGRTRIPIRNLMQLNQGSVIELQRAAGEPLDVFVNGTLIAQGEVVVVNERFGVRLTDVISPAERIKRLK